MRLTPLSELWKEERPIDRQESIIDLFRNGKEIHRHYPIRKRKGISWVGEINDILVREFPRLGEYVIKPIPIKLELTFSLSQSVFKTPDLDNLAKEAIDCIIGYSSDYMVTTMVIKKRRSSDPFVEIKIERDSFEGEED